MSRLSPKLNNKLTRSRRNFEPRHSAIFRNHRNSFGNHQQCSEVVRNWDFQVIWIQKSHAFDVGKVGRYNLYFVFSLQQHYMIKHTGHENKGSDHQR